MCCVVVEQRAYISLMKMGMVTYKKNNLLILEIKTGLFLDEVVVSGFQRNTIVSFPECSSSLNSQLHKFILSFNFCFFLLRIVTRLYKTLSSISVGYPCFCY